jgi:protein phosphatase
VRELALYGETTGEIDEFGLPVRSDCAAAYRGNTAVIYGHTPIVRADWVNNTLCIDTGCVFGGKLTALRWPEKELVEVAAEQTWFEPIRRLGGAIDSASAQADADQVLDIKDVTGRRWIATELKGRIVVAEENASAALEVMSRFAPAPQWLAYLPPTMSPSETSEREGWLERPEEAFAHFRERGRGRGRMRGEAHGLARRHRALRNSGRSQGAIWCDRRRNGCDLDPHGPGFLQ